MTIEPASRRRDARALFAAALLGSTSLLSLSLGARAQVVDLGDGNFTVGGTFSPSLPYVASGGSDATPTITVGSSTNLDFALSGYFFRIDAGGYTVVVEPGAKIVNDTSSNLFASTLAGSRTVYRIGGELQSRSATIVSFVSGSPAWDVTLTGTLRNVTSNIVLLGQGGADRLVMEPGSLVASAGGSIDFRGGDDVLVYNGGAFSGLNSIEFGTGDDLLELNASLTSGPQMRGGSGVDTVRLGASGSFAVNMLNNTWDRLEMRGDDWTLTGTSTAAFSSGVFVESGVLRIEGDMSSVTGLTRVTGGELLVMGRLGGALNVSGGGRLGGTGRIGQTTIGDGGVLAPGNSIGTLTIDGDLFMSSDAVFEVAVDPAGASGDRVVVNGVADLGGTVRHVGLPGEYRRGSTYTILTATGGFDGSRFDAVTSTYAFLTPELDYTANEVALRFGRNETSFASAGRTSNQRGAGGALESLGAGNPLYDAFVGQSASDAPGALGQLSGDVHAAGPAGFIGGAIQVQGVVGQRIQSAFQSASGVPEASYASFGSDASYARSASGAVYTGWGRVFGSWGRSDGDENAADTRREDAGFLVGADAMVGEDAHLGAYAGYSRSRFQSPGRAASGWSDNYHVGLYGGVEHGALRLSGGAGYSRHAVETTRRVAFPGFADELKASYHAHTLQAFGEAGYRIGFGALTLEPFAGLSHVRVRSGAFTETGGAAALRAAASDASATFSTLGLRAGAAFELGGLDATLRGMAGWRHSFGDLRDTARFAFAAGGSSFVVAGAPRSREAAIVEAGLDLAVAPGATLAFTYDGQFGRRGSDHGVNAQLRVAF